MNISKITYKLKTLIAKKKRIYVAQVNDDDELDGITLKEILDIIWAC